MFVVAPRLTLQVGVWIVLNYLALTAQDVPDSLAIEHLISNAHPNLSFAASARQLLIERLRREDVTGVSELIEFVDLRLNTDYTPWLTSAERLMVLTIIIDTSVIQHPERLEPLLIGSREFSTHPMYNDDLLRLARVILRTSTTLAHRRYEYYKPSAEEQRFYNLLVNYMVVTGYRARAQLNVLVEKFATDAIGSWRATVAREYFVTEYVEADIGGAFYTAYALGEFSGFLGERFNTHYGPMLGAELYIYRVTLEGILTIGIAESPANFQAGGQDWRAGKSSIINATLDVGYEFRYGLLAATPMIGLGLQSLVGPSDTGINRSPVPTTGNRLGLDVGLLLGYRIPFEGKPSIDLRIRFGRTATALDSYDTDFDGALYYLHIGFALVSRPYH